MLHTSQGIWIYCCVRDWYHPETFGHLLQECFLTDAFLDSLFKSPGEGCPITNWRNSRLSLPLFSGNWNRHRVAVLYTLPSCSAPAGGTSLFRHRQPAWPIFHKQASWNTKLWLSELFTLLGKKIQKKIPQVSSAFAHKRFHKELATAQSIHAQQILCGPQQSQRRKTPAQTGKRAATLEKSKHLQVWRDGPYDSCTSWKTELFVVLATTACTTWSATVDW